MQATCQSAISYINYDLINQTQDTAVKLPQHCFNYYIGIINILMFTFEGPSGKEAQSFQGKGIKENLQSVSN